MKTKEAFKEYSELVANPQFICTTCGRAAKKEENLCKPRKIKKKYLEF